MDQNFRAQALEYHEKSPFLLGVNAAIHILVSRSTMRRIVNMTALTVVDANTPR